MRRSLESHTNDKLLEWALVVAISLALFVPFLSLQYDTNGLIEAAAVESGELFHKNHVLYRVIGYGIYRALQFCGYSGRALVVLQAINAVCGALGIGFAYLAYRQATGSRAAAAGGAVLLSTSFTYWLFSTDASYITLAGGFGAGALAAFLCIRNPYVSGITSGVLTTLSVLTWQASVFLIPALILLSPVRVEDSRKAHVRRAVAYLVAACLFSGLCYFAVALIQSEHRDPASIMRWLTTYGENGTLPMWGRWETGRILTAAQSALRSFIPTPLAIPLSEMSRNVQLGRVAVDIALAGLAGLALLGLFRIHTRARYFLFAYACFMPFIVWWDPFEPKWFLIPNIFLAGFFAVAADPWLVRPRASLAIFSVLLFVAATNFITTVRPRHEDIGPDRRTAQCVAQRMKTNDLLIAAEWGWPDYLEYVENRRMLSVIGNFSSVEDRIETAHRQGGTVYTPDPAGYSISHLAWLRSQSGVTPQDLARLAGRPAFSCNGREIFLSR
jgi:hypothetical protein